MKTNLRKSQSFAPISQIRSRRHSPFRTPNSAFARSLRFEPLESRNLLTGVVFDSVMTFGDGTNPTSVFGGVAVDDVGNKVITGYFQGTVDFDPDHAHPGDVDTLQAVGGGENVFVAKYNADGLLSWVRGMGGAATQGGENARSKTLALDEAGDVLVAGTFQATVEFGGVSLTSAGGDDVFFAKLASSTGDVTWALRWGDGASNPILDDSLAVGTGPTAYLAIGEVLKVNTADGSVLWQKSYSAMNVAVDEVGNLYLGKHYQGPFDADPGPGVYMINHDPNPINTALLKVDANGDLEWARVFETSGTNVMTTLLDMAIDGSGDVLMAGYYYGPVDFDPDPGVTASLPSNLQYYVTKFDSSGELVSVNPLVGETTPKPGQLSATINIDLFTDSSSNIYAIGNFNCVVDLDPGVGVVSVTSPATNTNAYSTYLMSLSSGGEFRWGSMLGNTDASVSVLGRAIDSNHNVHLGGSFYGPGPVDFDPGAGVQQVTSLGRSGFLLKLNPTPGITVSRTTGLLTGEAGISASIAVSLDSPPSANVTIPVATSDATEGVTNVSSLTFTPVNWNVPQVVQVTGLDDGAVDGDVGFSVVLGASVSADPQYNGLEPSDVSAVNLDNDVPATKFYVVDDASANKTYEYAATGSAVENYSLISGNTAPRGAASTAAGDKVWVVDANKKVYIYNPAGALLGSWTAGSLPSNAKVQGISTNGTDVWIVESQGDKVYRYTGAATRTSGSQNAAGSFNLNSNNRDATDLVTDGTSIWVLNNSSADKVFKYTVGGSLLGSWTISGGGGSPTGITIDPSGASASIWIVDSASDRVSEFSSAKSRTSGSQSPSASFALAAGNTNPQGLADPPTDPVGNALRDTPPTPGRSTRTASTISTHDAALLSLSNELESLLGSARRRK